MAELMKHREAGRSRRFNMLAQKFIAKYGVDSEGYDVIRGWRANASYFYIVTEFVHDEIDIATLQDFNAKYNERDRQARDRMDELIAGPKNKAVKVMSTLV